MGLADAEVGRGDFGPAEGGNRRRRLRRWRCVASNVELPESPLCYALLVVVVRLALGIALLAVSRARGREQWHLTAGAASKTDQTKGGTMM